MAFSRLPLCSSNEVISALERLGAYAGRAKRGSHASYHLRGRDGRIRTGVVILGKREIPKGTLRYLLKNLDISVEDFLEALRRRA